MTRKPYLQVDSLKLLIALNISLFILPTLLVAVLLRSNQNGYGLFLDLLGGLIPVKFWAGEYWRVITSLFLHADLLHIASNMFSLYLIGRIVQRYFGGKWLVSFYIITGLGGSLFSVFFLPGTPTVGASGAVFGLVGVLLAGSLKRNRFGVDLPFRPMDIAPLAVYAFAVGLIPGFAVNNWAHLGGLLTGLGLGFVVRHKANNYSSMEKLAEKVVFIMSLVVLALAYVGMGWYFYQAIWV
ncbi:rhomboid family intramembrane serine protease [Candidatus Dojkabacteria bacterium]|uniref:Rhomboid family intramembrane serine protease n=1 Tax=Candidatus Dojkabacteria bacterium TaxID=2099670 RepID=A0A955L0D4_9BACT|nr:rhomboid family intramembrane serine protease [Candidatus Dojkabacteria bacterium]